MPKPSKKPVITSQQRLVSYIDNLGVIQSVSVATRTTNKEMIVAACNKINARKGA